MKVNERKTGTCVSTVTYLSPSNKEFGKLKKKPVFFGL